MSHDDLHVDLLNDDDVPTTVQRLPQERLSTWMQRVNEHDSDDSDDDSEHDDSDSCANAHHVSDDEHDDVVTCRG